MSAKSSRKKKAPLPKYVRETKAGTFQVFMADVPGGPQRSQGTFPTVGQAAARALDVYARRTAAARSVQASDGFMGSRLAEMTVSEAFKLWHERNRRRMLSEHEWKGKAARAETHIFPLFGDTRMIDLRRDAVEDWAWNLIAERGYAKSYVRGHIEILTKLCEWYVERCRAESVWAPPMANLARIPLPEPTNPITMPRARRQEPITVLQARDIMLHLEPRFRVIFALQYCCGLRIGEVLGLSPYSVDWLSGLVQIRQQTIRNQIEPRLKTESSVRDLPLPRVVLDMLREFVEVRLGPDAIRPFAPEENGRSLLIFCSQNERDVGVSYALRSSGLCEPPLVPLWNGETVGGRSR